MRKLWIAAVTLLLLFVLTVVTAALSLNRLIAGNQDRILAQAQAVLGREVAVGRISVSLWDGLAVRLDDVRVADDPRFGSEDFVRIATLSVRAKLWRLLRQHFEVGRIVATHPRVSVIRNANGEWNYASLRPLAPKPTKTAAGAAGIIRVANVTAAAPSDQAKPPPGFAIADIAIADGTLVVVDRTHTPARTTRVVQLDAAVHSVGPAAPLDVRLAAAVDADARNVDVHGTLGPLNTPAGLPLQLDGTLGPLPPSTVQIDGLHLVALLTPAQVHVSEATGRALGGAFTLAGEYPFRPDAGAALRGTVRDLDIAAAASAATGGAPARIGGKAHLIIDLSAAGASRAAIEASLGGRVVADIHQGVITGLNIPNEILGKASRLPVVGDVVSRKIKPKYARLFADPDTHFETLHGTFTISEQRVHTDDLAIIATDYGVVGHGWVAFNRLADLAGTLRMSRRFSDDIVADVHAAKYLLDDGGQLALPFHLRGPLGEAKPNLDNDDIMTLVQRGAVRGGAKDLLDKFFGQQPQATPGARKNLIEEGLRHLFGR
jgi:uncharacterized protein involved in outer membrane biogenesis